MKITKGVFYQNRTRKYLLPSFYAYGNDFVKRLEAMMKVSVGIGDWVLNGLGIEYNHHIFVLVDADVNTKTLVKNMVWFRENGYLESNYYYGDIHKSNYYMLVFKVPISKPRLLKDFIDGDYSNMYTLEEIKNWFGTKYKGNLIRPDKEVTIDVLTKNKKYMNTFLDILNNRFGVQLGLDWMKERDMEYDFKPITDEEFFNTKL